MAIQTQAFANQKNVMPLQHLLALVVVLFIIILKKIKMKKTTIIFWVSTIIIFLMEGLLPAFTSQTELAKQGISHLGYPPYFGNALVVFKVLGAIALVLPMVKGRMKEWVYAGFAFDFVFASISHFAIDGIHFQSFLPLLFLGLLLVSYFSYHKLNASALP